MANNKLDLIAIEIEKIKEREDAFHPNNIESGHKRTGVVIKETFEPPTVGKQFIISSFITSEVQEIIDDHTFKTWNSIYTWKII